jgi:hypothetical protein
MLLAAIDMTQYQYPPYTMNQGQKEEFWFVMAVLAFCFFYGWYRMIRRQEGTWRE